MGTANAESIWVLSRKKDNKILNQIKGDAVSPLPLPAEYAEDKEICTGSANLVLFEDRLYLFWTSKNLFILPLMTEVHGMSQNHLNIMEG